jgi:colanic acid biosynthesis glycosyl transferase WcaI
VPREKISVVENGVETQLFAPDSGSALKRQLGMEGKFVVSYIGTIGMAHGLDTLIESANRLRHSNPEIVFLILGEGTEKASIATRAREHGLDNVRFIDQQPREQIPACICASAVCLVLLKKADLFKTVIPTKMLEFMACACPVILGVDGQARTILEEARGGVVVEPENSDALVSAIRLLAANPEMAAQLGRNGREYVMRKFSRGETADKYIRVLEQLLNLTQDRKTEVAA